MDNEARNFKKYAAEKQPLKRSDPFYKEIEFYPDECFEDYLLFELYFRMNIEDAHAVYAEKDSLKRLEIHRSNLENFLKMIEVVRDAHFIRIDTRLSDEEILEKINLVRLNAGIVQILKYHIAQVPFLLKDGRNGAKKNKQAKAADFFFLWDCLERWSVPDNTDLKFQLSYTYIKNQFDDYEPMGKGTYEKYSIIIDQLRFFNKLTAH